MDKQEPIMVHKELASLFWAMDNYFKEKDKGSVIDMQVYLHAAEIAVNNLRKDRERVIKEESKSKIIPFKK